MFAMSHIRPLRAYELRVAQHDTTFRALSAPTSKGHFLKEREQPFWKSNQQKPGFNQLHNGCSQRLSRFHAKSTASYRAATLFSWNIICTGKQWCISHLHDWFPEGCACWVFWRLGVCLCTPFPLRLLVGAVLYPGRIYPPNAYESYSPVVRCTGQWPFTGLYLLCQNGLRNVIRSWPKRVLRKGFKKNKGCSSWNSWSLSCAIGHWDLCAWTPYRVMQTMSRSHFQKSPPYPSDRFCWCPEFANPKRSSWYKLMALQNLYI